MNKMMAEEKVSMKHRGKEPLCQIPINGSYILGIYKGSLSDFDILLRYRQKEGGNGVELELQNISIGLWIC